MVSFYESGLTVSGDPLWGDCLVFTTQFPGAPGTTLIDLGRGKGWVDLGVTQCFWIQDP